VCVWECVFLKCKNSYGDVGFSNFCDFCVTFWLIFHQPVVGWLALLEWWYLHFDVPRVFFFHYLSQASNFICVFFLFLIFKLSSFLSSFLNFQLVICYITMLRCETHTCLLSRTKTHALKWGGDFPYFFFYFYTYECICKICICMFCVQPVVQYSFSSFLFIAN